MHKIFSLTIIAFLCFCTAIEANPADSIIQASVSGKPIGEELSQQQLLDEAASCYASRRYADAVTYYETAIRKFGKSAELHYNLGNAYFKSNHLAPAILNYERALRLDPGDEDARANLVFCQTRIVDQITPVGEFLLVRWYNSLGLITGSNGWSWVSIIAFLFFSVSLAAFFLARKRWIKKVGFYLGILTLLVCCFAFNYAYQAKQRLTNSDEAILFTLSVTAKSSPDQSGNDLFVLHEGIKVKIRSVVGNWSEIELADGNIGWLQNKDIVLI
jgi:tetratricopeptide (TPR) repeat protein